MLLLTTNRVYTAGDSKFTPSYVTLDGKVLQFYAYMKEDVPEIPAEVSSCHFRMRATRITCHLVCVRPYAKLRRPIDYLLIHTYIATRLRATESGALTSATSWWTIPFALASSNRSFSPCSFLESSMQYTHLDFVRGQMRFRGLTQPALFILHLQSTHAVS